MSKAKAVRLSDEDAAWLEKYAAGRGVNDSAVLKEAFAAFREGVERGVPGSRVERAAKVAPVRRASELVKGEPQTYEDVMRQRQARLSKQMGWGS